MKHTAESLSALTLVALVALYNEITGEEIKKFSTKPIAIRRVLEAQTAAEQFKKTPSPEAIAKEEAAQLKAAKAAKTPKAETEKKPEGYNRPTLSYIRKYRENSARGKMMAGLLKGATFEQLKAASGYTDEVLHNNILQAHTWLGYGLKEDPKTHVITAFAAENADIRPYNQR